MSIKSGLTITKDNTKKFFAGLRALTKQEVMVGIPQEKAQREGDPASNALIGYTMEFGSPLNNIPPRPFLIPGVQSAKEQITKKLGNAAKVLLENPETSIDTQLGAAGMVASNSVKRKITQGPFEPLAEATLAARRRRGRTGEKPLIDTGQLRNSITYVIRLGKGK